MHREAILSLQGKGVMFPNSSFDALEEYFHRYSKEYCAKYIDGTLGEIVFGRLLPRNQEVRREVIKACQRDDVTKMFYDKKAMYKTLKQFGENFKEPKRHYAICRGAKELLIELIEPVKLKPLTVREGMDLNRNIKNFKTSAGSLAYGKKKGEIKELMVQQCLKYKHDLSIRPLPALGMRRSQLGSLVDDEGNFDGSKVATCKKGRLVWCLEAGQILFESQYARPLTEHLATHFANIATGKDPGTINGYMMRWNSKPHWICIDYSKYDSTVQSWLIKEAFDIIKLFFDKQYHAELDWIMDNFINLPILMPDGELVWAHKGIKSGSYFTQVVGSIINAYMVLSFLMHKNGCNKEKVMNELFDVHFPGRATFMCMGDDNIIFTYTKIDEHELAEFMKETFGIEVSPTKCDTKYDSKTGIPKKYPIFLKRSWTPKGSDRNLVDLLINLLHPERVREYQKKNFSPWHVIYGYFVTYPVAMKKITSEYEIFENMHLNGGILKLKDMDPTDLPGSLGSFINQDRLSWINTVKMRAAAFGEDVV